MMHIWHLLMNFDAHLLQLVVMHAHFVYFLLFGLVFLQIGVLPFFFLPSNPFLFVCGAVWAASGLNLYLLLMVLIAAAVLGNFSAYFLGKTVGQAFLWIICNGQIRPRWIKLACFTINMAKKGF